MKTLNRPNLIFLLLFFCSCSKEIISSQTIGGTYTGTFQWTNNDPTIDFMPASGSVTVSFDGINYTSTGNSNYIPAGGSGKFFVRKDAISFTDISMHTANFDWNLLLNGSYAYKLKGDSILLSKKVGYNTYLYRLGKR